MVPRACYAFLEQGAMSPCMVWDVMLGFLCPIQHPPVISSCCQHPPVISSCCQHPPVISSCCQHPPVISSCCQHPPVVFSCCLLSAMQPPRNGPCMPYAELSIFSVPVSWQPGPLQRNLLENFALDFLPARHCQTFPQIIT